MGAADPEVHVGEDARVGRVVRVLLAGGLPARRRVSDLEQCRRVDRAGVEDDPDWQAVWSQWRRWRDSGTWAAAMRVLAREVRLATTGRLTRRR
jgi:hypothetical protein